MWKSSKLICNLSEWRVEIVRTTRTEISLEELLIMFKFRQLSLGFNRDSIEPAWGRMYAQDLARIHWCRLWTMSFGEAGIKAWEFVQCSSPACENTLDVIRSSFGWLTWFMRQRDGNNCKNVVTNIRSWVNSNLVIFVNGNLPPVVPTPLIATTSVGFYSPVVRVHVHPYIYIYVHVDICGHIYSLSTSSSSRSTRTGTIESLKSLVKKLLLFSYCILLFFTFVIVIIIFSFIFNNY